MKYRKKAVEVEAFRLLNLHLSAVFNNLPKWFTKRIKPGELELISDSNGRIESVVIKTLEGKAVAEIGDYIIKGAKNEIYPCKADIFHEAYEPC